MSLTKFLFNKKQDQPSKQPATKPVHTNQEIDPKIVNLGAYFSIRAAGR